MDCPVRACTLCEHSTGLQGWCRVVQQAEEDSTTLGPPPHLRVFFFLPHMIILLSTLNAYQLLTEKKANVYTIEKPLLVLVLHAPDSLDKLLPGPLPSQNVHVEVDGVVGNR